MTSYTDNRGYPFPSSPREAGNGGLHSELLARAVAADLDVVDATWAGLLQRSSINLTLAADITPISASGLATVFMDTVEKQVGPSLVHTGIAIGVTETGGGWYHITGQVHSKANGTITADAQHRVQIEHTYPLLGLIATKRMYYSETFQSGTVDMYAAIEVVLHLAYGEEARMKFFHTNTGSDARVVAANTRLTATLIVPDA